MLDKEYLETVFDIDFESGVLTWKLTDSRKKRNPYAGRKAGTFKADTGYLVVRLDGRLHPAHRLIAIMAGMQVSDGVEIDHINGIRDDNRLCNLRVASRSENARNTRKPLVNTSGIKGVSLHRASGLWRARVKLDGKEIMVGYFKTKDEAGEARRVFVDRIHGEFARHQ